MKTILSIALILGVCGLTGAQDDKKVVDPLGTWKCEYEIGDMKRTSELTIKKEKDKLVGTMSWPDQKEAKLKDLELKDGDLTFSAERKLADNTYIVEYKLTISGDELEGKGAVDAGGQKTEFDIKGKRKKEDEKGEKEKGSGVELRTK